MEHMNDIPEGRILPANGEGGSANFTNGNSGIGNRNTGSDLSQYNSESDATSLAASRAPVELKLEKTPVEFGHLLAALERQIGPMSLQASPAGGAVNATGPYVLGITSAVAGEGKTSTALHLALTIARDTFKRVCLIDFSLGAGDMSTRLGLPTGSAGMVQALEADDSVVPTLQLAECDNLVVIPAGKSPANAARLARSPRIGQMILSARDAFDLVILDLPDVASDNVLPISQFADGIIMVARSGATPSHVVARALDNIGRDKVLGVTLNRVTTAIPVWMQRWLARA